MIPELSSADPVPTDYDAHVSDRLGIITEIQRFSIDDIFPDYELFRTVTSDLTVLFECSKQVTSGGAAVEKDVEAGRARAIGETLERYSIETVPTDTTNGTLENVANPLWWEAYSDKQYETETFSYERLEPTDEIPWIPVKRMDDGAEFYTPAFNVYLSDEYGRSYREVTSTGVACHTTLPRAALGGLLEVVERDAIMVAFLHDLTVPRLDWSTVKRAAPERTEPIETAGLDVHVLDITMDTGIPTYFAIATDGTWVSVGSGCSTLAGTAVEEALEEVMHTYYSIKEIYDIEPEDKDVREIRTLNDHLFYYQGKNRAELLDRATNGPTTDLRDNRCSPHSTASERLSFCLDALAEQDIDAYLRETTTADLRNTGFRTVKVLVPEMVEINARWEARELGKERLHTLPEKMGYQCGITPSPHPMP